MASLKRRYQETTFEGDLNPPPRFRPPGGRYAQLPTVPSTTTTKFTTADAVKAFEDGVEYVVIQRIRGAKLQNRKTMAELLKELKNSTRVLTDVFKHGARLHNLQQNQIQGKIQKGRAVLQSDYIKKNFWRLVDDLKDEDPKKNRNPDKNRQELRKRKTIV